MTRMLHWKTGSSDPPMPDRNGPPFKLGERRPKSAPPNSYGFTPPLTAGAGETLGLIAVEDLTFPEFRDRYLNLALLTVGGCALAIRNARTFQRITETSVELVSARLTIIFLEWRHSKNAHPHDRQGVGNSVGQEGRRREGSAIHQALCTTGRSGANTGRRHRELSGTSRMAESHDSSAVGRASWDGQNLVPLLSH